MRYAPVSERERRGRRRMGGGSDVVVLDESDESTDEVQIMEPQHSVTRYIAHLLMFFPFNLHPSLYNVM